jgi:integrase
MPSAVIKALGRHRVRQLEAKLACSSLWQETANVLTSRIGTPLDLRNATSIQGRAEGGELASDPTAQFAAVVRHAPTRQGVSPRVVMETLGHSQVSLTLNTYSHVLPALQQDAAAKMDAIWGGR